MRRRWRLIRPSAPGSSVICLPHIKNLKLQDRWLCVVALIKISRPCPFSEVPVVWISSLNRLFVNRRTYFKNCAWGIWESPWIHSQSFDFTTPQSSSTLGPTYMKQVLCQYRQFLKIDSKRDEYQLFRQGAYTASDAGYVKWLSAVLHIHYDQCT